MTYDPGAVMSYFDAVGDREWARLEATLRGRISYAIHRRILLECARSSMRVLDIGSGPGRFAIDLARLGCEVTLADLSPTQLQLARQRLDQERLLGHVAGFHQIDVTDMRMLDDSAFDLVVCYGGVVSYARDRYAAALAELRRVVRTSGVVLVSVMSLYGTLSLTGPLDAADFLAHADEHLDVAAVLAGDGVVYTRPGSREFHQPLALFTSGGLRHAMRAARLGVVKMAAANPLLTEYERVPRIEESPEAAARLEQLEIAACQYPGLLDTGSHLIAVGQPSEPA
jgi:SAM-dependent methyltransferase